MIISKQSAQAGGSLKIQRREGGSFLFESSGVDGGTGTYLYPGLERAIRGEFRKGRLISGRYGKVTGAK